MSSVAALLRARGFEVDLCLLERGSLSNAERLCREADRYPVVLLKPNDADHTETLPLVAEAKRAGVFRRVFACGPFATLNAARLLVHYPGLDGVILGEPELTVAELAGQLRDSVRPAGSGQGSVTGQGLVTGQDLTWSSALPGGYWRDPLTGEVVSAPPRPAPLSLDDLPLPARDIEKQERAALVNLETQRGCAGNCSFCHVPALREHSPGPRRCFRSISLVADEIEHLNRDLGKRFLIFNDPTFWAGPEDTPRVTELAREIIARGLKVWFMVYLRCDPFPPERTLGLLVEAGLVRVFLGVENGNLPTLRLYRKGRSADSYAKVRALLQRYGVSHHIGFIVFHPFAAFEEVASNLDYLYRAGKLFRVGAIVEKMRLVPGSSLREMATRGGTAGGAARRAAHDEATARDGPIDQAYDYTFADGRVAALHEGLREFFCDTLGEAHLKAEFYCTNTDLALHIVRRFAPGFEESHPRELTYFCRLKQGYEDLLHRYFATCLEGIARKSWGAAEVASPTLHAGFARGFRDYLCSLEIAWGVVSDRIRSATGAEVMDALFTGREKA